MEGLTGLFSWVRTVVACPRMRRFELSDGKSNKFWEIEVDEGGFQTRHGRIGSAGRATDKRCASASVAAKQAASAIAAKLSKGYVEIAAGTTPAPTPAGHASTDKADPITALERTLVSDPDALDDWQVYADALAAAGDPRGELVGLGVALARGDADAALLRAREHALLQAHANAWFGKFVANDDWRECFGWTLQTGFWGRIRLWVDYDHRLVEVPKALTYALAHPSAKFLRTLDLGLASAEGDCDYGDCIRAIVRHGPLASLRSLTIGDFEFPDETEISWATVGDVGPLWPLLPGLESLTLRGGGIGLGTPASASLRSLVIETGGLPGRAAESLARARLPKLERLALWFGTEEYGGSCTAEQAGAILQNPGLASIRKLGLANGDFADELAEVVASTELPAGLERLDLSMGTMTDAGAERLLANAGRFARLAGLDLTRNYLSPGMCERISAALPNAALAEQKTADGEHYYVSVGE
jgi:predicted DNA-binding WGR domain protein